MIHSLDNHRYDTRQANRKNVSYVSADEKYVSHEPKVVLFAYAAADPRAVVVEFLNAVVTNVTVTRSRRTENLFRKLDTFRSISCSADSLPARFCSSGECCKSETEGRSNSEKSLRQEGVQISDFALSFERTFAGMNPGSVKQVRYKKTSCSMNKTPSGMIRYGIQNC